jgi:hypothetical protein
MKNKNRLLLVCSICIAVSLVICVCFSILVRLKEPVFLTNCICVRAVPPRDTGYLQPALELQYLTNVDEMSEVVDISFEEAPDIYFQATEEPQFFNSMFNFHNNQNSTKGERIGKYSLRSIYLYMNNYFIGDWEGEVECNTALVTFSNGSRKKVNVGRILFYSETEPVPSLDMVSTGSTNQGITEMTFRVRETLHDLKLESPFIEEIDSVMELTINSYSYKELEDLVLNRGNSLTATCRMKEDGERDYDVYDIHPKLTYTKEDGTKGYTRIRNITQRKYFNGYLEAIKYLIKRGGF